MKKLDIEIIKATLAKEGYWLLSTKYKNNRQKLECICPKGHKIKISYRHFQQGVRCRICAINRKKHSIEFVRSTFEKRGYTLLSTEYIDNKQKLEYRCLNGHRGKITFSDFQQGKGCPECFGNKKLTIKFIRERFESEGCILLTEIYINAYQKLDYVCSRGHRCKIAWNKWQQNHRCQQCYLENNRGPNNSNWNKNLTDEERRQNRDYLAYKKWRASIYKRDNYTCQICGKKGIYLNAHHLFSYTSYPDLQLDLDNGICICEDCHKLFHHLYGYGNNTREQFEEFRKNFAC